MKLIRSVDFLSAGLTTQQLCWKKVLVLLTPCTLVRDIITHRGFKVLIRYVVGAAYDPSSILVC
jgi:hypothetical protein